MVPTCPAAVSSPLDIFVSYMSSLLTFNTRAAYADPPPHRLWAPLLLLLLFMVSDGFSLFVSRPGPEREMTLVLSMNPFLDPEGDPPLSPYKPLWESERCTKACLAAPAPPCSSDGPFAHGADPPPLLLA